MSSSKTQTAVHVVDIDVRIIQIQFNDTQKNLNTLNSVV